MEEKKSTSSKKILALLVDGTILFIAIVLSIIILVQHNTTVSVTVAEPNERYFRPVDPATDLIFGNPEAELFIVEYGDLECPYCREFHPHIKTLIQSDWGISGRVAWVWRNGFHINKISAEKARTLECIRLHAGNQSRSKAWKFIEESLFGGVHEGEYPFDRYKIIIEQLDISFERIESCRKTNEPVEQLALALEDIKELRIDETPYLQFISGNGELLFESAGLLTIDQLESFLANIFQYQQVQ